MLTVKKQLKNKTCGPCEKGTTSLLIGATFTAIGIYSWVQNTTICTACIVGAPLFLSLGIYLRYLYKKGSTKNSCPIKTENTPKNQKEV